MWAMWKVKQMRRIFCALLALALCAAGTVLAETRPDWCKKYGEVYRLSCVPARYLAREDGYRKNWSLLDADGEVIYADYIGEFGDFYEGITFAYAPNHWTYTWPPTAFINEAGELITDFEFYSLMNFYVSDGLCRVQLNDGSSSLVMVDTEGNVAIGPGYDNLGDCSEGMIAFYDADKAAYGYLNRKGEVVIEPRFTYVYAFHDGRARVMTQDHKYGYIDATGAWAFETFFPEADDFSEGLACVETADGRVGFIDPDGEFAIAPDYIDAQSFQNGYAAAAIGSGVIEEVFCGEPEEGRLWGVIDREGNVLIPFEYDEMTLPIGANLRADEFTAEAKLGDEVHVFRFEDGRAIEIAALEKERGIDGIDWRLRSDLRKRLQERAETGESAGVAFDEAYQPPCFDCADELTLFYCALRETVDRASGSDAVDVFFGRLEEQPDGVLSAVPFACDALVFVVAEDSPLDNLTSAQIKDIYSGEITEWSQLDTSESGHITAFQQSDNSNAQSAFERFMADIWLMRPPQEYQENEYGPYLVNSPFRALPGAIGFTLRSYWEAQSHEGLKLLSVDGVRPTAENIRNGSYPFVETFYAMLCTVGETPNVQALVDWVVSDPGQELVERSGYVGYVES